MPLSDKEAISKEKLARHWRFRMHEIIFEADTFWGKAFDILLLAVILSSIVVVMLESVNEYEEKFGTILRTLEWIFTILFTVEYIARIISIGRPFRYIFSFLGIVDLLAVIPTYLSLFVSGSQFLIVIRTIRLLRIFRIFKLARYMGEADVLVRALRASKYKITVFLFTVLTLVVITGTVMYLVEGEANGFTSIPRSIYWAVVTLTTVGYGDIAPGTVLGQFLSSIIMIMGYGIIAVPTGIVTVEMAHIKNSDEISTQACPSCSAEGHDHDALYCKYCGSRL